MLRVLVLGSAAGGGVPQWNCNCHVCELARANDGSVVPRTQSSIAVSADGANWCVLNCSPDIRQQIAVNKPLWPAQGKKRHSPISSVVLTNADVDHICGLLTLREKQRFELFATNAVLDVLAENPVFSVLDPAFVKKHSISWDAPTKVLAGLEVVPFKVPGKVALFNEQKKLAEADSLDIGAETEDTIGLKVSAGDGATFYYIPGCASMTPELEQRLAGAKLVFFDGTVWLNEEMVTQGLGAKTGGRMGHMNMAGPDGSIAAFADLDVKRKVFIHINNSNHVLIEESLERREAESAGWEIACDGMEFSL